MIEIHTIKFYRDVILGTKDQNSTIDIGSNTVNGYFFNEIPYNRNVDDLIVFKRALNPNEIFTLFNLEYECYTCVE
jgi:hypothetical protein